MKRVVAVALVTLPMWVVSGVAGWWLGNREVGPPRLIAPAPSQDAAALAPQPPSESLAASKAVEPAKALPPRSRPLAAPRRPIAPPAPARIAARASPKAVEQRTPTSVAETPPPLRPEDSSAIPALALGSSDLSAPEQALEPAPAVPAAPSSPGVLVVVSLASQRAFVFKDGELWGSSVVSTGRAGKRTPVGRYTILEKQVHHRSRTYDNAPMPYMQRLTWGGVAMHAGHVTGRPASHGCIRLPRAFAKKLYNLTDFHSTTVVVTNKRANSSEQALKAS